VSDDRVVPNQVADVAAQTMPALVQSAPPAPPAVDASSERNPSFHPGAKIGDKFVIESLIGEGGLGVVVAAKNLHLDQTVAIKYLRPSALASPGVAERFLREARLAARIRSEHVVRVYDVGTLPDGAPYMVMEYLAGTDLGRQLSASGPLPVDRAVDYVLQACEALAEAHIAGIVHRDIKPDNLFVATSTGGKSVVKILDFGISKISRKHTTSGRELTEAGDKFGTPVYMSPEQLMSTRDVDARADVWAIGVVLYELLTGKLPFDGDLPELCTAILHKEPVPLTTARPYLPVRLQAVVERCLAKDVAARFQNVAELAQELREFATPASQARIDHVVTVIRGAGENVRPATLIPSATDHTRRDEVTLAASAARDATATTGRGVGSWGIVLPRERKGGSRAWLVVLAGTGVCVLALAAVAMRGNERAAPAHAAVAAVLALPPADPTTYAPAATLPALEQPTAEVPPEASTATPDPTAAPSAVAAPRAPTRHGGKPAGSAARPGASPGDPNAVINPFE
jgi:eukaryotic-like serine/threonine-protein kinase